MEARKLATSDPEPFQLSLRVRHPSIDPAEITRELKLAAEYSFRKGEPRESESGIAAAALHAESYWLGTLPSAWWTSALGSFLEPMPESASRSAAKERVHALAIRSLDMALGLCTGHFLRKHAAFIRRIQAEGGQVRLLVEIAPRAENGFALAPEVCNALVQLGMGVDFEFTSD